MSAPKPVGWWCENCGEEVGDCDCGRHQRPVPDYGQPGDDAVSIYVVFSGWLGYTDDGVMVEADGEDQAKDRALDAWLTRPDRQDNQTADTFQGRVVGPLTLPICGGFDL